MGGTAGRTTLPGEGLQHQDGHSHLLASTVPVCEAYDPAFAYELASVIRQGIDRMYPADGGGDDVFYYVTLYNENYVMPARPDVDDLDDQIIRGIYRWAPAPDGPSHRALDPVLGNVVAGGARGPGRAGRAVGRGRRAVERDVVEAAARRGPRVERRNRYRPDEPAAAAVRHRAVGRVGRPDRGGHRLHEGGRRFDLPMGARGPQLHRLSAPTASGAATPARRCGASSRPTRPTWW